MPLPNRHSQRALNDQMHELLQDDVARQRRNRVRRIVRRTIAIGWGIAALIMMAWLFPRGRFTPFAWWRVWWLCAWVLVTVPGAWLLVTWLADEDESAQLGLTRFALNQARAHSSRQVSQGRSSRRLRRTQPRT